MKNCEPFVFGPLFAIQSKLWMIENIERAESRNAKVCQFHQAKTSHGVRRVGGGGPRWLNRFTGALGRPDNKCRTWEDGNR